MSNTGIDWPDLPTSGFIAGRSATLEDVERGEAVFSMKGEGLGPLPIPIPQYAWWSETAGERLPMILVQAERSPDGPTDLVGLRDFAGQAVLATFREVELLGKKKPV